MKVLAIDPGNHESAYCLVDTETLRPVDFAKLPNAELRETIMETKFSAEDYGAIEMLQSYGNLIGKDVLETAVWIGRFEETLMRKLYNPPERVFRMEEKMHICHDSKAKDSNIRRALIDRFCDHDFKGGKGTIKNPDFFYGFAADVWAAYAVGLTYIETRLKGANDQ